MKQKILFINGHLNTGGVERSLIDILRHLDDEKYSVDLLLLEDMGDYADELPSFVHVIFKDIHNTYGSFVSAVHRCIIAHDWMCLVLRLLFLLSKIIGNIALKPAAFILLGKHRYDCAIGFRPGICSDIVAYSVQSYRKITWWHHGEFNNNHIAYAKMCKRMNAIAVVSSECMKMLVREEPEIESKLVHIPNMLDVKVIEEKAGIYFKYSRLLQIVSVGRLAPEKHFENIIPVAKTLVENNINFEWTLVGEGSERERLEWLIDDADLANKIVLVGSQLNPYPFIAKADLFVHPSYVESQGLTVLEAMALGIPCVVTKSLGPQEFIEDGINGLLTDQSPESLKEKVLEILQNKELYKKIKQNTKCPEQFMPERVMKQITKLIDG